MAFRKLGATMVAVLALGALFASVSQAQQWYVNGAKLGPAGSASAFASTGTTGVFTSKVLGLPLRLTWIELSSESGKIVQSGSGSFGGISTLTGTLIFRKVVADQPAGCRSSGEIKTVALTGTAQMGNTLETANNVYVKVLPAGGEVFATIKLTECAAAGSYQVKGSLFVKATNPTGTEIGTQEGITSGAINSSQGGALTLGKEPATLEGTVNIRLESGLKWGLRAE